MIEEIVKFVDTIPEEYHTKKIPFRSGLYIYIDLNKHGKPIKKSYRSFIIDKKNKMFDLNKDGKLVEIEFDRVDLEKREYYSRWIESNKSLDSSKKIHSSNSFSLWFKAKNISGIKNSFDGYFKKAVENSSENRNDQIKLIKEFCSQDLIPMIKEDPKFKKVDKEEYVKVYFNVDLMTIQKDFKYYLKKNLFNKEYYNLTTSKGEVGLSGFLNGANSKKQFMLHKTSHYEVNNRITQKTALNLYKFERLLSHMKPYDKLPNPLPIFIDKDELNTEIVRLYNDERVLHFREIVKRLFEQHQVDLSDYYLINWKNTADGPVIYDFDFVPQFRYKLSGFEIKNPMGIKDYQERKIDNIFQFELDVVHIIFNNALVVKTKSGEILLKYFDEIDPKYMSATTYQSILKYRKSFYDYIYKSRIQAITGKMFYDLIVSAVIDDIKHDEEFAKTYTIRDKLNILFSLNHIFDKNNNNFKGVNMASKIPEYQERMRKLFNDENYHIAEDDEFAFAAGQLIYYILKQSKSSNKSHALLEPYISKNDPEQFRKMIIRGIDQYKHAFEWYGSGKGRFEKLAGDILGYECKTNIKEILPIILAGYFSQSLIYEPSPNTENK